MIIIFKLVNDCFDNSNFGRLALLLHTKCTAFLMNFKDGKWKCAFHVPRALLQVYKTFKGTKQNNEIEVLER